METQTIVDREQWISAQATGLARRIFRSFQHESVYKEEMPMPSDLIAEEQEEEEESSYPSEPNPSIPYEDEEGDLLHAEDQIDSDDEQYHVEREEEEYKWVMVTQDMDPAECIHQTNQNVYFLTPVHDKWYLLCLYTHETRSSSFTYSYQWGISHEEDNLHSKLFYKPLWLIPPHLLWSITQAIQGAMDPEDRLAWIALPSLSDHTVDPVIEECLYLCRERDERQHDYWHIHDTMVVHSMRMMSPPYETLPFYLRGLHVSQRGLKVYEDSLGKPDTRGIFTQKITIYFSIQVLHQKEGPPSLLQRRVREGHMVNWVEATTFHSSEQSMRYELVQDAWNTFVHHHLPLSQATRVEESFVSCNLYVKVTFSEENLHSISSLYPRLTCQMWTTHPTKAQSKELDWKDVHPDSLYPTEWKIVAKLESKDVKTRRFVPVPSSPSPRPSPPPPLIPWYYNSSAQPIGYVADACLGFIEPEHATSQVSDIRDPFHPTFSSHSSSLPPRSHTIQATPSVHAPSLSTFQVDQKTRLTEVHRYLLRFQGYLLILGFTPREYQPIHRPSLTLDFQQELPPWFPAPSLVTTHKSSGSDGNNILYHAFEHKDWPALQWSLLAYAQDQDAPVFLRQVHFQWFVVAHQNHVTLHTRTFPLQSQQEWLVWVPLPLTQLSWLPQWPNLIRVHETCRIRTKEPLDWKDLKLLNPFDSIARLRVQIRARIEQGLLLRRECDHHYGNQVEVHPLTWKYWMDHSQDSFQYVWGKVLHPWTVLFQDKTLLVEGYSDPTESKLYILSIRGTPWSKPIFWQKWNEIRMSSHAQLIHNKYEKSRPVLSSEATRLPTHPPFCVSPTLDKQPGTRPIDLFTSRYQRMNIAAPGPHPPRDFICEAWRPKYHYLPYLWLLLKGERKLLVISQLDSWGFPHLDDSSFHTYSLQEWTDLRLPAADFTPGWNLTRMLQLEMDRAKKRDTQETRMPDTGKKELKEKDQKQEKAFEIEMKEFTISFDGWSDYDTTARIADDAEMLFSSFDVTRRYKMELCLEPFEPDQKTYPSIICSLRVNQSELKGPWRDMRLLVDQWNCNHMERIQCLPWGVPELNKVLWITSLHGIIFLLDPQPSLPIAGKKPCVILRTLDSFWTLYYVPFPTIANKCPSWTRLIPLPLTPARRHIQGCWMHPSFFPILVQGRLEPQFPPPSSFPLIWMRYLGSLTYMEGPYEKIQNQQSRWWITFHITMELKDLKGQPQVLEKWRHVAEGVYTQTMELSRQDFSQCIDEQDQTVKSRILSRLYADFTGWSLLAHHTGLEGKCHPKEVGPWREFGVLGGHDGSAFFSIQVEQLEPTHHPSACIHVYTHLRPAAGRDREWQAMAHHVLHSLIGVTDTTGSSLSDSGDHLFPLFLWLGATDSEKRKIPTIDKPLVQLPVFARTYHCLDPCRMYSRNEAENLNDSKHQIKWVDTTEEKWNEAWLTLFKEESKPLSIPDTPKLRLHLNVTGQRDLQVKLEREEKMKSQWVTTSFLNHSTHYTRANITIGVLGDSSVTKTYEYVPLGAALSLVTRYRFFEEFQKPKESQLAKYMQHHKDKHTSLGTLTFPGLTWGPIPLISTSPDLPTRYDYHVSPSSYHVEWDDMYKMWKRTIQAFLNVKSAQASLISDVVFLPPSFHSMEHDMTREPKPAPMFKVKFSNPSPSTPHHSFLSVGSNQSKFQLPEPPISSQTVLPFLPLLHAIIYTTQTMKEYWVVQIPESEESV